MQTVRWTLQLVKWSSLGERKKDNKMWLVNLKVKLQTWPELNNVIIMKHQGDNVMFHGSYKTTLLIWNGYKLLERTLLNALPVSQHFVLPKLDVCLILPTVSIFLVIQGYGANFSTYIVNASSKDWNGNRPVKTGIQ